MNGTRTATADIEAGPRETATNAVTLPAPEITAGSTPANSQPKAAALRGKSQAAAAITLGLAVAMAGFGVWWRNARHWVSTDNAYLAAPIHQVSSRIAGTVEQLLVDENQTVAAGQLLARLDSRDLLVKRQQAEAQLAQAQAAVTQAEALINQAAAQVTRETANSRKAQLDFARAEALYQQGAGAISRQEYDQARASRDATQANTEALQATLRSAEANALAAKAQEKAAIAGLEEARLQLTYTEISAPVAGKIGRKNLELGNRVQPGQTLLALVDTHPWVIANFKETQIARLVPGQSVEIRVDAFPGKVLPGRIDTLSPASGAQFALLPPDNATGNFTRIVQRIPVNVVFSAPALDGFLASLAPGMSAVVRARVSE